MTGLAPALQNLPTSKHVHIRYRPLAYRWRPCRVTSSEVNILPCRCRAASRDSKQLQYVWMKVFFIHLHHIFLANVIYEWSPWYSQEFQVYLQAVRHSVRVVTEFPRPSFVRFFHPPLALATQQWCEYFSTPILGPTHLSMDFNTTSIESFIL